MALANELKQVKIEIVPEKRQIILSAHGEFESGRGWQKIEAEETLDIVPGPRTCAAQFLINSTYVLDALGEWPVTIRYDGYKDHKHSPILLVFASFAYMLMPLDPTKIVMY